MHARMLAQQFEQEAQNGRRKSRLPPDAVARELANRPDYFRSISGGSESAMDQLPEVREDERPTTRGGLTIAGVSEKDRPMSHYPMLGNIGKGDNIRPLSTPMEYYDAEEDPQQRNHSRQQDYFGISAPRASSPEPVDPKAVTVEAPTPVVPSLTSSVDSVQSSQPRTLTNGSTRSLRSERGLAPPRSPAYPRSPHSFQSIRSVRQDSGDDDSGSTNGSQAVSWSRKFSGSSGLSRPQSPFSPYMQPMHRSPSMTSEYSINGSQNLPKPSYNFSRPLSGHGNRPSMDQRPSFDSRTSFETRPSTELPHRHPSEASTGTQSSMRSPLSRQSSHDAVVTPYADTPAEVGAAGDDYFAGAPGSGPTYTYAKFALPRGRHIERTSAGSRDSWIQHQFTWDQKQDEAPRQRERKASEGSVLEPCARAASPSPYDPVELSEERELRSARNRAFSSAHRSRSADPRVIGNRQVPHKATPSVLTDSTDRTIRPVPLRQRAASAELTPDEHLEIGIQAHSAGQLNKSTYHLRLAAKAGLPTAMLLYALACRHGWGMRPNQEDGVMWLRKAIDGSQLEITDVEAQIAIGSRRQEKLDPAAEAHERKKRKAQFALAIYELGISYMNGWGCPKDKPLALRCYEIAGSWGDCDALAEAGFCYTQGVGCKKDLMKAAALYRKAADGGMSMAGNSW